MKYEEMEYTTPRHGLLHKLEVYLIEGKVYECGGEKDNQNYWMKDLETGETESISKAWIYKLKHQVHDITSAYVKEKPDYATERIEKAKELMGQNKDFNIARLLLEPIDVTKYDYVRLNQQDTWGLLVREDHPLNEKTSLTAEDVAPYPLILPLRENIRAEILHWLGREEKEVKIPLFYTLLSNAALMVAEGLGCAFCMDGALAIRSDPRLRFIPLEPRRMTHSVLVWKKNNLFSPATSLFIQEINLLRAQIE